MIDLNSFFGSWPFHPVLGQPDQVWNALRDLGVKRIFTSPLEGCWWRNPQACNGLLYEAAFQVDDVWPVPVLDPTIKTWAQELELASSNDNVKLVRLLPNYHGYSLVDVMDVLQAVRDAKLGVLVQLCMEDPRRHHPLAQVPNVPIADVLDLAERISGLKVVIGGGKTSEIRGVKERLIDLPDIYVDTSQIDGLDAMKVLVDEGLGTTLVFGSHAPLFVPHAAVTRVITDLDDESAIAILSDNALRLLGEMS